MLQALADIYLSSNVSSPKSFQERLQHLTLAGHYHVVNAQLCIATCTPAWLAIDSGCKEPCTRLYCQLLLEPVSQT